MRLLVFLILCMTLFTVTSQSLKVGLQSYAPPFSIQIDEKNQFSGFEAQLIVEICRRLHADCTYVPMQFLDFFPQILAGNIDLALGQISITLARAKEFSFSLPYMLSVGQFMVNARSSITNIEAIQRKRVAIFKGSLFKKYLLETYDKNIVILEYDSSLAAIHALTSGYVDAVLLTTIAEKYWVINSTLTLSDFRFIGNPIFLGNGIGIMSNLESYGLLGQINQIIIDMEEDGTYLRLYNLYFSWD